MFQGEGEKNYYSGVYGSLLISCFNFLGTCIAIPFVEKLRRKLMFFGSVSVDVACLVVFIVLYAVYPDEES